MVIIRLFLGGSTKRPCNHVTVADSRVSRDGRGIERLGFHDPIARGAKEGTWIDLERLDHWESQGAQLSGLVKQIVKSYRKASAQVAA